MAGLPSCEAAVADDLGPLLARVPEALRGSTAYHVPKPPRLTLSRRQRRSECRKYLLLRGIAASRFRADLSLFPQGTQRRDLLRKPFSS